jgi:hypothetical protein
MMPVDSRFGDNSNVGFLIYFQICPHQLYDMLSQQEMVTILQPQTGSLTSQKNLIVEVCFVILLWNIGIKLSHHPHHLQSLCPSQRSHTEDP